VNVSDLGPHHFRVERLALGPGRDELVVCDYFRIEKVTVEDSIAIGSGAPYYMLLMCLKGSGRIAGEDFNAGTAWLVPALGDDFKISGKDSEWILSYTAAAPAEHLSI
jgi:mannose-6-phosphate isomerase class I